VKELSSSNPAVRTDRARLAEPRPSLLVERLPRVATLVGAEGS
jgi:hypothetical protein